MVMAWAWCQNGAQAMAKKEGKTYEQILQFFFTIEIQSWLQINDAGYAGSPLLIHNAGRFSPESTE